MSRGSELALWSGALLDTVGAVVGFSPSGISWSGLDAGGPVDAPAWTFRDRPPPFAPIGAAAKVGTAPSTGPVALEDAFAAALAHPGQLDAAVIPIEDVRGPLFFVSGEADAMWPATAMTDISVQRARQRGIGHRMVHLRYGEGGHVCAGTPGVPVVTEVHHPLTGGFYSFGGTRAANAAARADSWPQVLAFLDGALSSGDDDRHGSGR